MKCNPYLPYLMEPTPVNPVAVMMSDMAGIAQQVRALSNRPSSATEDQVKALQKMAERDRPLVVNVETAAVVEQLMGKVEQQRQAFEAAGDLLIKLVDNRTDCLNKELTAQVAAVQQATAAMTAGAKLIPSSVAVRADFYGFTSWRAAAVVAGAPLLVVLLMLWFTGMFSRVPAADFERLAAENASIRAKNAQVVDIARFYQEQIKRYRKKNKKAAPDFPKYTPTQ